MFTIRLLSHFHSPPSLLGQMSQVRYDISTVCDCELMEEKPAGQAVVRLTYYVIKEGFKSSEFETYAGIASELPLCLLT